MFTKRMQFALLAAMLVVLLCLLKLAWLQVWQYQRYAAESVSSLTSEELIPTPRGRIVVEGKDKRDGPGGEVVLAEDAPSFDVSVRVRDLKLREVVLNDVRKVLDLRRPWDEYNRRVRELGKSGGDVSENNPEIVELRRACDAGDAEYGRQHEDQVRRMAALEPVVADLAEMTGANRERLARGILTAMEHVGRSYAGAPPPVAVNIDRSAWDRLYLRQRGSVLFGAREPIPGVLLTNGTYRRYPLGTLACHAVGYVSALNAELYEGLALGPEDPEDVDPEVRKKLSEKLRGYGLGFGPEGLTFLRPFEGGEEGRFLFRTSDGERSWLRLGSGRRFVRALPDERVGHYGVERTHNQALRGEHAYRVSVRTVMPAGWRSGAPGRDYIRDTPPHPGADLKLTLDLNAQRAAEKALAEAGRPGAAVFLDPVTGAVLALASYPPFDPNAFASRRNEEINRLFRDPAKPMLCRAYQSAYPPGSTFKSYLSAGAMEEGQLSASTTYTCPGVLAVGNHTFECLGQHGSIEFHTALKKSCNVYFYHVGIKMGGERLGKWGASFGFGEPTGLDLPGEFAGSMYSPAYKRRRNESQGIRRGNPWTDGDSAIAAIGQGGTSVSPLQNAVAMAAIANGGKLVRPHLVAHPGEDYTRRRVALASKNLEVLRKALAGVVNEDGTGRLSRLSGVTVAGKTGSAQNPHGQTHAWFVGFANAEDPTVAFCVVLENAGHGGSAAAPVARKVLEALFQVSSEAGAGTGGTADEQDLRD